MNTKTIVLNGVHHAICWDKNRVHHFQMEVKKLSETPRTPTDNKEVNVYKRIV